MRKIIRLTETDLLKIVKKVIKEDEMLGAEIKPKEPIINTNSSDTGFDITATNIGHIKGVKIISDKEDYLLHFFEDKPILHGPNAISRGVKKGVVTRKDVNHIKVIYNIDPIISKTFPEIKITITPVKEGRYDIIIINIKFNEIVDNYQSIDITLPKNMAYKFRN